MDSDDLEPVLVELRALYKDIKKEQTKYNAKDNGNTDKAKKEVEKDDIDFV